MTDAQRRFMHARDRVMSTFLNPVAEMCAAATELCAAEKARADQAQTTMEVLRPVWAQGWTSDGVAAQASSNALAELWQELGAQDQTEAMQILRDLKMQLRVAEEHSHD